MVCFRRRLLARLFLDGVGAEPLFEQRALVVEALLFGIELRVAPSQCLSRAILLPGQLLVGVRYGNASGEARQAASETASQARSTSSDCLAVSTA